MFEKGDKVAYSVQFLKSIGMSHSFMSHARGTILTTFKLGLDTVIAVIDWDNSSCPANVNIVNLAKVGPNPKFCQC